MGRIVAVAVGLIFLAGMMGVGKSTVGALLAEKRGCPFIDTDRWIETRAGKSLRHLFAESGEKVCRDIETDELRRACREPEAVIALGGGALERTENLDLVLATGLLVYLRAEPELLVKRNRDTENRPMLADCLTEEELRRRLSGLLARRETGFMAAAIVIDVTGGQTSQETARLVFEAIRRHGS